MSDAHIDAPAPADRATCQRHIEAAKEFPYDGVWKGDELQTLRHAEHPAYQVARGILHNFSDRRGIKWALRDVDQDVREEIVDTVALFITADHRNQVIRELIEKAKADFLDAQKRREEMSGTSLSLRVDRAKATYEWLKYQMEGE